MQDTNTSPPSPHELPSEQPHPTFHKKRRYIGLFGLLGFMVIAQLALLLKPPIGAYATVGLLIILIAAALGRESFRQIAIVLAFIPLLNMVMMVLPIGDQPTRLTIYYGALLALSLAYRFLLFRDQAFIKVKILRNYLPIVLLVATGAILGGIGFLLADVSYPFHAVPFYIIVFACVIAALAEEMYFRTLVQQKALDVVSPNRAILFTALLYTGLSIGSSLGLGIVAAFVLSGLLSAVYKHVPNPLLTFIINMSAKLTFVILIMLY